MLTARDAVQIARKYMLDVYGTIDGLNVEEIELEDNFWSVTMGYWEFLPEPKYASNPLSTIMSSSEARKVRRVYKQLKIGANSGDVISMKIRAVPSPEPR
jgi:hypothetical protein